MQDGRHNLTSVLAIAFGMNVLSMHVCFNLTLVVRICRFCVKNLEIRLFVTGRCYKYINVSQYD